MNVKFLGHYGPPPSRYQELTPPDFFLWSWLKDRAFATVPQFVDGETTNYGRISTNRRTNITKCVPKYGSPGGCLSQQRRSFSVPTLV